MSPALRIKSLFIISGPAGSGKDLVLSLLAKELPVQRVVTTTTRPRRDSEREGRDYYFVSKAEFESAKQAGLFLEYSVNENNEYYGVTKAVFEQASQADTPLMWKLDWKGVINAKKLFPKAIAVCILAPKAVMMRRLHRRDDNERDASYFQERERYTDEWLKHLDIYDHIIENPENHVEEAVSALKKLIQEHS